MVDIIEIAQDLRVIDQYSHSIDPFERLGFNDGIYSGTHTQRGTLKEIVRGIDIVLTDIVDTMGALPPVDSIQSVQTARREIANGLDRYDAAYQNTKTAMILLGQSDIFYDDVYHDENHRDRYFMPGERVFLPSDMLFHQIDELGLPENFGQVMEIVAPRLTEHFYLEMEYRAELSDGYKLLEELGICRIDRQFGKAFFNPLKGHADHFWDEQVLDISRREMVIRLYEIAHRG